MKKREKKAVYLIFSIIFGLLMITNASAGLFDWLKQTITGKATSSTFHLNVTVGGPQIIYVFNQSDAVTINEGPAFSTAIINFTVLTTSGWENVNLSSGKVNLSFTGENTRENASCRAYQMSGNYVNFTCNVTMWWWDVNATWNITAYVKDNQSNVAQNDTQRQGVGSTPAMIAGPGLITWPGISPGASNQTANNDPYVVNNTGNYPTTNLSINGTNLHGETTNSELLYSRNFSVAWETGGTPPNDCNGTLMLNQTDVQLAVANVTKGNYTSNDGINGQERLYFCLKETSASLSNQAYSTILEGPWRIKYGAY